NSSQTVAANSCLGRFGYVFLAHFIISISSGLNALPENTLIVLSMTWLPTFPSLLYNIRFVFVHPRFAKLFFIIPCSSLFLLFSNSCFTSGGLLCYCFGNLFLPDFITKKNVSVNYFSGTYIYMMYNPGLFFWSFRILLIFSIRYII
ncbi:MAG: hypothetical protein PWR06_2067, partial [Thermoanaerobacteraceae bacterium]|nr:hypothetical protein [Thermoanaerobacteraceae bacterium]